MSERKNNKGQAYPGLTQEQFDGLIIEYLKQWGWNPSYEWPGYIDVAAVDGKQWAFGTANEKWGGDADDRFVEFEAPSNTRNAPEKIAGLIAEVLKGGELKSVRAFIGGAK